MASLPPPHVFDGARAEVLAKLVDEFFWEIVPPDMLRCLACSRRAREVRRRDARGRRQK